MSRPGWACEMIIVSASGKPRSVLAMSRGDLAVHRMIGKHEPGWCITFAPLGLRMASGGRLFRSDEAAMDVVDMLLAVTDDWAKFFGEGRDGWLTERFNLAHDMAEDRGAFLDIRIRPNEVRP